MHIDRFRSLSATLSDLGLTDADIQPIAETKSGSSISGIADTHTPDAGYIGIFKDGKKDKLLEERESVQSWHDIYPGLAPQILKYRKQGKNASLLIEHLPGQTFESILLTETDKTLDKTLRHLTKTLKAVWTETKRKNRVSAGHMTQLQKRLPDVLDIHPDFDKPDQYIGPHRILGLRTLIGRCGKLEEKLHAPFRVYIHGDFNLDNIIYDPDSRKIRFIDLHRSTYQDYTQDVSVFMVSNYRLNVFDHRTRTRIHHAATTLYDFAREFAVRNRDPSFDVRLALGLARSFITSTRFILDRSLAKNMMVRGVYLLDQLARLPTDKKAEKAISSFHLPVKDLFT